MNNLLLVEGSPTVCSLNNCSEDAKYYNLGQIILPKITSYSPATIVPAVFLCKKHGREIQSMALKADIQELTRNLQTLNNKED